MVVDVSFLNGLAGFWLAKSVQFLDLRFIRKRYEMRNKYVCLMHIAFLERPAAARQRNTKEAGRLLANHAVIPDIYNTKTHIIIHYW